jgi:ABC-type branched-subunit amino acid transport system ATPase component
MLDLANVSVSFGESEVLKKISLSVSPGEIVGIIGPNGCGKTTLLNAVSGFAGLSGGSIGLNGRDITGFSPYLRARAGMGRSFQSAGVFREMTVEENVTLALEYAKNYPWWWKFSKKYRETTNGTIETLLSELNLSKYRHSSAGILSGGQLRLLELLRMKIGDRSLLLIDEPTAGVAPVMRQAISDMIRTLAKEKNRSMLIVEHDLKFLFNLVHRVIVLVDGEKYLEGTPEEVQNDVRLKEIYFGTSIQKEES